jgi:hypothetical protein
MINKREYQTANAVLVVYLVKSHITKAEQSNIEVLRIVMTNGLVELIPCSSTFVLADPDGY